MHSLISLLTYQSNNQRWLHIAGALALSCSAVMIFGLMVEINRKPRLDRTLTFKQFWLILLGIRIAAATYWHRDPELWGTVVVVGVGIASLWVMVETIRERLRDPGVWEDPYAVIEDQAKEIAGYRRALGLPVRDEKGVS